jgi:hypothetical protein
MMKWKDEFHEILLSLIGGVRYGVKIRLPHALIMTSVFRHDMSASEKLQQIIQLVREHAINLALFATIYKSILLILKVASYHFGNQCSTKSNTTSSKRQLSEYLRHCGRILVSLIGMSSLYILNRSIGVMINALLFSLYIGRISVYIRFLVFGSTSAKNDMTIGNIPNSSTLTIVGCPKYSHHALIAGLIGGYTVWGRYTSINYQIVLYLSSRVLVALLQRLASTSTTQLLQQLQENHLNAGKSMSSLQLQKLVRDRIYSLSAATIWGIVMFLFEDSPEFLHPSLRSSMDEIYRFQSKRSTR